MLRKFVLAHAGTQRRIVEDTGFPHPRERQVRHRITRSQQMDLSTTLRQSRPAAMSDDEWKLRLELAACYRLFDRFGWNELIFNHITVRVPAADAPAQYLINPFGLNYNE